MTGHASGPPTEKLESRHENAAAAKPQKISSASLERSADISSQRAQVGSGVHLDLLAAVDVELVAFSYGYTQGRLDGAAAARELLPSISANAPSHVELTRRRQAVAVEPCRSRCGHCSACIRAGAVRRNRGDWLGVSRVDGAA